MARGCDGQYYGGRTGGASRIDMGYRTGDKMAEYAAPWRSLTGLAGWRSRHFPTV